MNETQTRMLRRFVGYNRDALFFSHATSGFALSPTTLRSHIAFLKNKGYIEDAPGQNLQITSAGMAALRKIDALDGSSAARICNGNARGWYTAPVFSVRAGAGELSTNRRGI